jgi:branched-chain amino acid transport system permease protein
MRLRVPPMPFARDAMLSALAALVLFLPIVGLVPGGSENTDLIVRPGVMALLVAATFFGRLALLHYFAWRDRGGSFRRTIPSAAGLPLPAQWLGSTLLIFAVAWPLIGGRYGLDVGAVVLTYVMLGWGLNIVVGLAGLLDLGYVAFYAVGAYSYAILSTSFGVGFWIGLPIAGALAALVGILLGFPVLRLRGDYLAVVTLGFGEIVRIVLLNWTSLTNGPNGIGEIPRPTLFGLHFSMSQEQGSFAGFFGLEPSPVHRLVFLYYLVLALALLTNWATLRIRRTTLGRAWEALREDEIACQALGINVAVTKLTAFAMGAMFAGFAGAFFAARQAFISPESFTFFESTIILAIVVLGGLGSQTGTALAAVVMIGGFEIFRSLADYRMLGFGLALVVIMIVRPRGLVSTRTPTAALTHHRTVSADHVREGRG